MTERPLPAMPDGLSIVRGLALGAVRPRGWVRPGLVVHLAKYDHLTRGQDTGCFHVYRADGATLCGRRPSGPPWRDAGWGDSELVCCKLCGKHLWRDPARAAARPTDPAVFKEVNESDNWVRRLDDAARRAPAAYVAAHGAPAAWRTRRITPAGTEQAGTV